MESEQSQLKPDAAELVAYLKDRDVDCPLCGCNLRRLSQPRCPECGQPLRLGVLLSEPFTRAFMTSAAVACAGGGIGAFIGLISIVEGWPYQGQRMSLNLSCGFFIAMIPVAAMVLRRRCAFLRRRRETQWWIAIALILANAIAGVVFTIGLGR